VNGGTTTQLSVLGGTSSSGGESVLNYTWIMTGPKPVSLSANGTNAAKNAIATFIAVGTYTFQAHIVDTVTNLSVDSNVLTVVVNPTVASVMITNKVAALNPGQLYLFNATVLDQFGQNFITPVSWSATSGAMNAGAFTAPLTEQTLTVTASAQGHSDTDKVTVIMSGTNNLGFADITSAKAYPVPFKSNSGAPGINFTNLAPGTRIRIFTMTGRIVQTLTSPDGSDVLWTSKTPTSTASRAAFTSTSLKAPARKRRQTRHHSVSRFPSKSPPKLSLK